MRKIEQDMLRAIRGGKGWTGGNTTVLSANVNGWCTVLLHGNRIAAARYGQETGALEVQPDRETFRAWPTATTASRLRALSIPATIRKGVAYIGDQPA